MLFKKRKTNMPRIFYFEMLSNVSLDVIVFFKCKRKHMKIFCKTLFVSFAVIGKHGKKMYCELFSGNIQGRAVHGSIAPSEKSCRF